MNKTFDGLWWLPEQPNNRLRGKLSIDDDRIELMLDGVFAKQTSAVIGIDDHPVIFGITSDNRHVSCFHCMSNNWTITFTGLNRSSFIIKTVIEGLHIETEQECLFRDYKVAYSLLDSWKHDVHFKYQLYNPEATARVELSQTPSHMIEMPELVLEFGVDVQLPALKEPLREMTIRTGNFARFIFNNPVHLNTALSHIMHFNSFLTVITNMPSSVTSIQLNEIHETIQKRDHRNIYLHRSLNQTKPVTENPHPAKLKLTYFKMKDPDRAIQLWYSKKDKLHDVVALYTSGFLNSRYYDQKFLALCQAVESYHRRFVPVDEEYTKVQKLNRERAIESVQTDLRKWLKEKLQWAHEPSLRKRLMYILELYSTEEMIDSARKRFVDEVVSLRNYLTHYERPKRKQFDPHSIMGTAVPKLENLLVNCFLYEMMEFDQPPDKVETQ